MLTSRIRLLTNPDLSSRKLGIPPGIANCSGRSTRWPRGALDETPPEQRPDLATARPEERADHQGTGERADSRGQDVEHRVLVGQRKTILAALERAVLRQLPERLAGDAEARRERGR